MNLTNISVIKDLLKKHGFRFSKALGQNFLINPSVCPRMVEQSNITKNTGVIEIGPGIGVLTAELAKSAKKVLTIETDRSLKPILAETLADFDNIKIIWDDVMKLNLKEIIAKEFSECEDIVVCANLPYYITTPIIMMLLEEKLPLRSITALVQKEAGERLAATPGTRKVGAITYAVWYYSAPALLFDVSPGSFLPAPNVNSSVLKLDVRKEPLVTPVDEKLFFAVIKSGFSMRRKTIINCLNSTWELGKPYYNELFESLGISVKVRAENLTLEDFEKISNALFKKI